jgi:hypothetical protein
MHMYIKKVFVMTCLSLSLSAILLLNLINNTVNEELLQSSHGMSYWKKTLNKSIDLNKVGNLTFDDYFIRINDQQVCFLTSWAI